MGVGARRRKFQLFLTLGQIVLALGVECHGLESSSVVCVPYRSDYDTNLFA